MPFFQIKKFLCRVYIGQYSLLVSEEWLESKESSNLLLLRNIGRVYSEVILLVKIGNFKSSVRLN